MASSSSEEQKPEDQFHPAASPPPATAKECVYKTKLVEFLGRTTPIVLQNDNGPCPLLAICNILLLRNNLNLSPDTTEVSQEKLLSLVAERLIDSNSNIHDKDEGYVENQQQNIADAIDLLPRLATGIDVNIKFRRIDDFEFTPECAIFDLLDIPLYHGWIVDPQDSETANAIGSKSYNALMEELVALETRIESKYENSLEEDCVDFAAATTATLGVPSPCLSKARSFDDSPRFASDHQHALKGDLEEEAELLRALQISQSELPPSLSNPLAADANDQPVSVSSDENMVKIMPVGNTVEKQTIENSHTPKPDLSVSDYSNDYKNTSNDLMHFHGSKEPEVNSMSKANKGNNADQSRYVESEGRPPVFDVGEKSSVDTSGPIDRSISVCPGRRDASANEQPGEVSGGSEKLDNLGNASIGVNETADKINAHDLTDLSCLSAPNADLNSDTSSGRVPSEALASSESEPIYEGEDYIMDPGTLDNEVREPVYEGEVVLANQADKSTLESWSKGELSLQSGELIKNFLKSNASQLTINGLFCLQAGLKERELCVFFRNNHFSTMFKFNDELYLLATDQGYITQSDLVWEKLNEVNGDSLFMTGNFKEFKVENHTNDSWNEHNAMSSTAEYIASLDSVTQAGMDINPDLQLAIALQQQEMDQRQQRQNTQHQQQQQQSITGSSRLITGPLVPRNSARNHPSSYSRPESKSKEKCILM